MTESLYSGIYLGASAKAQGICFALCFVVGLGGGVIALLYYNKNNGIERIIIDLIATLMIGGLYILCQEFFMDGKFEIYSLVAYSLGTLIIPLIVRAIKNYKKRKNE